MKIKNPETGEVVVIPQGMEDAVRDAIESGNDPIEVMQMKYGGIHINPANKGKFNATKKATGKTTEELTHSKNPLTRKRAIFAQNASRWKHQDGGQAMQQQQTQGGGQEDQMQQLIQMAEQALAQGASPEEVAQMLVQQGVPEQVVQQVIQYAIQDLQQQQQAQGQNPEEQMQQQNPQEEQAEMRYGGYMQGGGNGLSKEATMALQNPNIRSQPYINGAYETFIKTGDTNALNDYNAYTEANKYLLQRDSVQNANNTNYYPYGNAPKPRFIQKGYGGMSMYDDGGMAMYGNGGGIDNPGFRALPDYVQQDIINNMAYGGCMECGGKMENGGRFLRKAVEGLFLGQNAGGMNWNQPQNALQAGNNQYPLTQPGLNSKGDNQFYDPNRDYGITIDPNQYQNLPQDNTNLPGNNLGQITLAPQGNQQASTSSQNLPVYGPEYQPSLSQPSPSWGVSQANGAATAATTSSGNLPVYGPENQPSPMWGVSQANGAATAATTPSGNTKLSSFDKYNTGLANISGGNSYFGRGLQHLGQATFDFTKGGLEMAGNNISNRNALKDEANNLRSSMRNDYKRTGKRPTDGNAIISKYGGKMMQDGGKSFLKNQILNTRLPATNRPTLNPNFNRSTSTTSPLSLQALGEQDYGVSLNKNGLNLSAGLNLEGKNPAFRAGVDYGKGNWSGSANYSTDNNNFGTQVGYNNKGFNAGAGYQRNNDNNSFNTNAGYSNNGFNVGAGYQRNNNNNSFNANVGYDGDSPVNFNANYAYDKDHSFDTNVGLNLGRFSGGLNYGYNQEGDRAHNFGANANLGLGKNLNVNADANFDSNKNYQVNAGLKYNFQDGGATYADKMKVSKNSPEADFIAEKGEYIVNNGVASKLETGGSHASGNDTAISLDKSSNPSYVLSDTPRLKQLQFGGKRVSPSKYAEMATVEALGKTPDQILKSYASFAKRAETEGKVFGDRISDATNQLLTQKYQKDIATVKQIADQAYHKQEQLKHAMGMDNDLDHAQEINGMSMAKFGGMQDGVHMNYFNAPAVQYGGGPQLFSSPSRLGYNTTQMAYGGLPKMAGGGLTQADIDLWKTVKYGDVKNNPKLQELAKKVKESGLISQYWKDAGLSGTPGTAGEGFSDDEILSGFAGQNYDLSKFLTSSTTNTNSASTVPATNTTTAATAAPATNATASTTVPANPYSGWKGQTFSTPAGRITPEGVDLNIKPMADWASFAQKYAGKDSRITTKQTPEAIGALQEVVYDEYLDTPQGQEALNKMWLDYGVTNQLEKNYSGIANKIKNKEHLTEDDLKSLRANYMDKLAGKRLPEMLPDAPPPPITPPPITPPPVTPPQEVDKKKLDIETAGKKANYDIPAINAYIPQSYGRNPIGLQLAQAQTIRPAKLNIQSELNEYNRGMRGAFRGTQGNTSVNVAQQMQGLNNLYGAQNKLYGQKYNFDEQSRAGADQFNAQAIMNTDAANIQRIGVNQDAIARREGAIDTQRRTDFQAGIENADKQNAYGLSKQYIESTFGPYLNNEGKLNFAYDPTTGEKINKDKEKSYTVSQINKMTAEERKAQGFKFGGPVKKIKLKLRK